MQLFKNIEILGYMLALVFIYLPYVQTMFLPYVCLLFIPNIKKKFYETMNSYWIFAFICRHNQVHVGPEEQLHTLSLNVQSMRQTRTIKIHTV